MSVTGDPRRNEDERLRALAEGATPGPWHVPEGLAAIHAGNQPVGSTWGRNLYANAPFIAACSPDVILALLARVHTLEQALEQACDVAVWLSGFVPHEGVAWNTWDVWARPQLWEAMAARAVVLEGRPKNKNSGGLQSRPCESSGGEQL